MNRINMKIFRLYFMLTLLVIANCKDLSTTTEDTLIELGKKTYDALSEKLRIDKDSKSSDPLTEEDGEVENELPILPPIILLEFGESNSTSSDEKSKRTVENGLGYGYLQNNLLNGKYNYYFPGGKTGTTVSIEESISPFEPKTIIEPYKPITERPIFKDSTTTYQPNSKETTEGLMSSQPRAHQFNINYPGNHQIYNQRTKLQKYSPPDNYNSQNSHFETTPKPSIAYTTIRPNYKNAQSTYSTPKPAYQNYISSPPTYSPPENYPATTAPPSYESRYNAAYNIQKPSYDPSTTANPLHVDPSAFNLPKYTIENGIRYENKIVWRYPDGRIANTPPTSYVNSYSEFSHPQRTNTNYQNPGTYRTATTGNRQLSQHIRYSHETPDIVYQNPSVQDSRYSQESQGNVYENSDNYQNSPNTRFPSNTVSNIYDQRPAQFPVDQEPIYQSLHSSTSNTLNNYNSGASSQAQNYDFSYQQKYGLKQRENNQASGYEAMALTSKYIVDSPNPESSKKPASSSPFSKYSPQAQKYLTKVLGHTRGTTRNQYKPQLTEYNNQNYESLLNYNPSISQYIRNPASILNAQPTFIQAGNSLIPVIILRVDGAPPPVQSKPNPSINLKALLQQYLSEYAESNAALSQTSNYEYAEDLSHKPVEHNTLNELTKLTQVLSRFSQNQKVNKNTPVQKLANHPLEDDSTRYYGKTSYDTIEKFNTQSNADESRLNYGSRVSAKPKVKSVQIIENS